MRRKWWTLSLLLLQLPVAGAASFTDAERQWMVQHPVVTYAIDPYWPIEFIDKQQHRGLTREYLDHVAQVSGLRFEQVPVRDWADTLARLRQGSLDLSSAVSARLMDAPSRAALLVSNPYLVGTTLVITRSDAPVLFHLGHWQGKRIAIKAGGGFEQYLRSHYPQFELLLINDVSDALTAVAQGQADAAIGLDAALLPVIRRQYSGELHIAGALADMPVEIAMGISAHAPELLGIINKSLATLTSGDTAALHDKWITTSDYGSPSWASLVRHYGAELVALSLLLGALAVLAQRARRAQRKAQRSEAQTNEFLAMMSHEIRTPLNGLLSSVELLQFSPLAPRQRELAALANSAAVSLLELVDDVLEVARLDARQLRLNPVPTDVQALAAGVADIHRQGAQTKAVMLAFEALGLESIDVVIDPVRVRQVLSNLLSNAVKFTDNGRVELQVALSDTPAGNTLHLVVTDTGIGIDAEQQTRLFRAFAQADAPAAPRYGGFGLGLSICKQLVELMGGKIQLHSTPSVGTVISVTLPVTCAVRQHGGPEPQPVVPITWLPSLQQPSANTWILVVEDQVVNQKALTLQLASLGYQARVFGEGGAAIACLERGDIPDLILLDCYLPDMSGFEVAQRMRALEGTLGLDPLPIVAISAASDDAHRSRCLDSGMDVILAKPIRLAELSELLQFWLPEPEPEPQAPAAQLALSADDQSSLERMFVDTTQADLQALGLALHHDDVDEVLHRVHRMHGAALTMGVSPLALMLESFETCVRSHQQIPADAEQRLAQLRQGLQDYAAQQNQPPGGETAQASIELTLSRN